MPKRKGLFRYTTLTLLPVTIAGCASVLPTIPVVLVMSGALAQIVVSAGTPVTQSGTMSIPTQDAVNIGRGSLELSPSAITLHSLGAGKVNTLTQQAQEACLAACDGAGVDATTCDDVCSAGQLQITVWVAAAADINTVCTGGARDTYGPYMVTLDDSGNGVSVSPSSVSLQPMTIELMNAGELSMCLEVISPQDGEVLISEFTANVGL